MPYALLVRTAEPGCQRLRPPEGGCDRGTQHDSSLLTPHSKYTPPMPRWLATLALLGVTAVWGWTFVLVHDAVAAYSVQGFLAIRFAIAALSAAILLGRRLDRRSVVVGGAIGLLLAAGYLFQTWGLRFTTATNAGLITGLFVVLAPIADRLVFGAVLRPTAWFAVALSLVGMTLLTGRPPTELARGDLLVLGCAVAFGLHIAVLSRFAPHLQSRGLAVGQMAGVALVFGLLWPATGQLTLPPRGIWFALALTGLVASTLAYLIQTLAQRVLTTARTAVLLTTEPLFAAVAGFVLAGERLGPIQLVGAATIFGAVALSEIVPAVRATSELPDPR